MDAQNSVQDIDMARMMAIEEELSKLDMGHSTTARRLSLVVPPPPPAMPTPVMTTTATTTLPPPPRPPQRPMLPTLKPFPSRPNPLRINPLDERRPMTSSSRRLSFSSMSSTKRPIKYGKGKYARVELVPQPSDDDEDPLVGRTAARPEVRGVLGHLLTVC